MRCQSWKTLSGSNASVKRQSNLWIFNAFEFDVCVMRIFKQIALVRFFDICMYSMRTRSVSSTVLVPIITALPIILLHEVSLNIRYVRSSMTVHQTKVESMRFSDKHCVPDNNYIHNIHKYHCPCAIGCMSQPVDSSQ